jgi:hypothetical protein
MMRVAGLRFVRAVGSGALLVVVVLVALCTLAGAQEPAGTGTVTGRVMAGDTHEPARFALVLLRKVTTEGSEAGGRFGFEGSSTRTDAEGNFELDNVAPGDYYVTANAPGYVPERSFVEGEVNAGVEAAAVIAKIPVARVAVGSASAVTVTMERGAAMSGRVVWEDGSPGVGLVMMAVPQGPTVTLPPELEGFESARGNMGSSVTDDRGMFRMAGLPAGAYVVRCMIQTPGQQTFGNGRGARFSSPIRVYAPGVFRKSEAKAVTLNAGEERSDLKVVIDLRQLHTVSGHAGSINASGSVASGRVTLTDSNDSALQPTGTIDASGDFEVRYVPAGTYTMRVVGSSAAGGGLQGRAASFQAFSQTETVGDADVTGVAVTLTPLQTEP